MDAAERLRGLRAGVSKAVPACPGVYVWLGSDEERLYVGKSRNLRARMLSYLAPGNLRPDARQRHLVSAIRGFGWTETAGELMALLLEDCLIKKVNPRHNERQKDYRERRYLLLTDDRFPACLIVEDPSRRTGTVFGPFKDEYFAADLRTLVTDTFLLRACLDREPSRHSARYDLGQCPAPCRGAVSVGDYQAIAARVRAFLEGDVSWVHQRLSTQMSEASECLQFERAGTIRESIVFVERFGARQRFFRSFESGTVLVAEPACGLRYEFERGSLVRVVNARGGDVDIPAEIREPVSDRRLLLDRANIVYAWQSAMGVAH